MRTSAKHLLVELRQCASEPLADLELVRELMRRGARAAHATIVGEAFHAYSPLGVTGVLLLEESHFSVHTWPEAGYAALDFYSCGAIDGEPAARIVALGFEAKSVALLEVERGEEPPEGPLRVGRRASW